MSREKKPEEPKAGLPEWLATYGDLVTLLMCFFVLLFAFSSIDAQKFEAVMQSFQGSTGILPGGKTLADGPLVFNGMPEAQTTESPEESQKLEALKEQVEQYLQQNNLQENIQVELDARGLLLRFKDNILFDSGKAELKTEALTILDYLGGLLSKPEFAERYIRVEGHTDNVPISTSRFPSNWELSASRAASVIRHYIEKNGIRPDRFTASGYGEYYPVADNATAEGRALNRRVDIVILRESEAAQAPEN